MAISFVSITLILAAVVGPQLYNAIHHQLTVLGIYRSSVFESAYKDVHAIADTQQCEDIHYYAPGNVLFAACEGSILNRFDWFPPLDHLNKSPESTGSTGSIHVIDPKTLESKRLNFENFNGPFVTHGIDVIPDPDRDGEAVYIFAVNHRGNPGYNPAGHAADPNAPSTHPARSQVEIFHYVLKGSTVRHVRSVRHPLVKTPNDLYAATPYSFFVTNDHHYRGGVLRHVEALVPWLKWTDVVHVKLDSLTADDGDATTGVEASVALPKVWAANGMGHGKDNEVLVTSVLEWNALSVKEEIPVDTIIDNPSYYDDPYKTDDDDASGYVLAGLRRAIDLTKTHADPEGVDGAIVWYVRRSKDGKGWEKRVIYEDDGSTIRSASAAVLVPVEPAKGAAKEAMLFVTGFVSSSAVALRVTL